jgi:hypothetical protein
VKAAESKFSGPLGRGSEMDNVFKS